MAMEKSDRVLPGSQLTPAIRELDRRHSGRIDVRLLWDSLTDRVLVSVADERSGESLRFNVDAADALEAFRHPYAHRAYGAAARRTGWVCR